MTKTWVAFMFLLSVTFFFELIRAESNPLSCICDENTTISVETTCLLTRDEDDLAVQVGCICRPGFGQPKLRDQSSNVISCESSNFVQFPTSVRCFCDGHSAVADGAICIAKMENEKQLVYETGCRCANSAAFPLIVSEVFLSRVYVVRCFTNHPLGSSLSETAKSSKEVAKVRLKRAVNTIVSSSTRTSTTVSTRSSRSSSSTSVETTTTSPLNESTWSTFESSDSTSVELTEMSTEFEMSTQLELTTYLSSTSTEITTTEEPTTELTTSTVTTSTEVLTTTELSTTEESTPQIPTTTRLISTVRSTVTSNLTTPLITTTMPEDNGEINFGTCNSTSFSKTDKQRAEIILYIGAAWVICWTIATILTNLFLRVIGHHRFLDLMQEFGIIAIFVFMGGFVLRPDLTGLCKATTLVLQFFLMYFLLIADMQAIFLNTCFCEIYSSLYWTFIFSAWGFGFFAFLINQSAVTACKMTKPSVHPAQFFWAKKSCRGMPILASAFCLCFFCLLFGVDMQRLWLFFVYLGVCICFGPLVFVLHTYCYEKGSIRLFARTGFNFYKPCVVKKIDEEKDVQPKVDLRTRHPLTDSVIARSGPIETANLPPRPVSRLVISNPPLESNVGAGRVARKTTDPASLEYLPTSSQDLFNWINDRNLDNVNEAENVLFKKNV